MNVCSRMCVLREGHGDVAKVNYQREHFAKSVCLCMFELVGGVIEANEAECRAQQVGYCASFPSLRTHIKAQTHVYKTCTVAPIHLVFALLH